MRSARGPVRNIFRIFFAGAHPGSSRFWTDSDGPGFLCAEVQLEKTVYLYAKIFVDCRVFCGHRLTEYPLLGSCRYCRAFLALRPVPLVDRLRDRGELDSECCALRSGSISFSARTPISLEGPTVTGLIVGDDRDHTVDDGVRKWRPCGFCVECRWLSTGNNAWLGHRASSPATRQRNTEDCSVPPLTLKSSWSLGESNP